MCFNIKIYNYMLNHNFIEDILIHNLYHSFFSDNFIHKVSFYVVNYFFINLKIINCNLLLIILIYSCIQTNYEGYFNYLNINIISIFHSFLYQVLFCIQDNNVFYLDNNHNNRDNMLLAKRKYTISLHISNLNSPIQ